MFAMIGDSLGNPQLLVTCDTLSRPFKFSVINGAWDGVMNPDGSIYVYRYGEIYTTISSSQILCTDEARLMTSSDRYEEIFDNFHNPNYQSWHWRNFEEIEEKKRTLGFDDMDDDIPF